MLKIKDLILIIKTPNSYLYKSLLCNNGEVENKTEITRIFNLKGEYEINIKLENYSTIKYNLICEEDSKKDLEFKSEDIDRYKFNQFLDV